MNDNKIQRQNKPINPHEIIITIDFHLDYQQPFYYGVWRDKDTLAELKEEEYVFNSDGECIEYLEKYGNIPSGVQIVMGKWRTKKGELKFWNKN